MKLNFLFSLLIAGFSCSVLFAQDDKASLEARKAELAKQVTGLTGELAGVQAKLDALPGWRKGYAGLVGFNLTKLTNWRQNPLPYSTTNNINFNGSAFAHLIQDKYFWRNSGTLSLGWQKLQADTAKSENNSDYVSTVDVLTLSSLYGYRITPKLAASALAEFRTAVIKNAFNPAYLDLGIGGTWTPIPELIVVFHPLNYNYIFSKNETKFTSSLGCKIVADYNKEIFKGVKFKSNLSAFLSYKNLQDLSNVTWANGLNLNLYKGLGLGVDYTLRWNKQETQGLGNDLQSFLFFGLSYAL